MTSYREELWFETDTRRAYIDITAQVQAAVRSSGVTEGFVLVNAMHITASVYINDREPVCSKTTMNFWRRWPHKTRPIGTTTPAKTTAMPTSSANSWDAKSWSPLPRDNWIVDRGNKFSIGEFDGRRRKRVLVEVIGE